MFIAPFRAVLGAFAVLEGLHDKITYLRKVLLIVLFNRFVWRVAHRNQNSAILYNDLVTKLLNKFVVVIVARVVVPRLARH